MISLRNFSPQNKGIETDQSACSIREIKKGIEMHQSACSIREIGEYKALLAALAESLYI